MNLEKLWEDHSDLIIGIGYKVLLAVAILIASWILVKVVKRAIERVRRLDHTLVPVLISIARYAIYTVAVVIILSIFGVNTTSLIALLGAAGIAIGLALKDTLGNIAAGMMLLLLRPFNRGDAIQCSAAAGTVDKIDLFATTIHTFEGLYVSVPNGTLWSSAITNFSRNSKRRMDIKVGISYGDSIERGLEVLRAIIADEPRFLEDPAPETMVSSLGDSAVTIEMRAWAMNSDYWAVFWKTNRAVKERIEAAGLSIPFPQLDCHVVEKRTEDR
ncbi:MAG: mechanosensitive ion channel [Planctomycetia bacterium]|jgi:small conductance mechanosensitive channel